MWRQVTREAARHQAPRGPRSAPTPSLRLDFETAPPSVGEVLALQRSVGNTATWAVLQRVITDSPLDAAREKYRTTLNDRAAGLKERLDAEITKSEEVAKNNWDEQQRLEALKSTRKKLERVIANIPRLDDSTTREALDKTEGSLRLGLDKIEASDELAAVLQREQRAEQARTAEEKKHEDEREAAENLEEAVNAVMDAVNQKVSNAGSWSPKYGPSVNVPDHKHLAEEIHRRLKETVHGKPIAADVLPESDRASKGPQLTYYVTEQSGRTGKGLNFNITGHRGKSPSSVFNIHLNFYD